MRFILSVFLLLGGHLFGCMGQEKINGISLVGGPDVVSLNTLDPIIDLEANWITLMPFAYGSFDSPHIKYKNLEWQWRGEGPEGIKETALLAQERGLNVMIKPHIWFDHGFFTGHFKLNSEEDWRTFENDYHGFIMQFVEIAEECDVAMFCMGTELSTFCLQRPQFWRNLILDIRKVYSGKITYASNWDAFERVPFWSELDYIGVDAYFPLNDSKTPSKKELIRDWAPHKNALRKLYNQCGKSVVFTEWGFRSTDYPCKEPWESEKGGPVNLTAQANAFAATFECFWEQDWFAGGFIWKWFVNHSSSGGFNNDRFTPQNKPAQEIIKYWFKKYS